MVVTRWLLSCTVRSTLTSSDGGAVVFCGSLLPHAASEVRATRVQRQIDSRLMRTLPPEMLQSANPFVDTFGQVLEEESGRLLCPHPTSRREE